LFEVGFSFGSLDPNNAVIKRLKNPVFLISAGGGAVGVIPLTAAEGFLISCFLSF